jgi:DNA-binding LacI/PurR family transcriptional regulator
MRELENNNIICRYVGRGSFVASRKKLNPHKMLSKLLLIIPNYTNPIFSIFQEKLEKIFFEHGILVESILTHFLDDDAMFKRICCQEWSGIVGLSLPERMVTFARSRKIPLVKMVDSLDHRKKYNQLVQDFDTMGKEITDMLFEQGHRNIVCAGGEVREDGKFKSIAKNFKGKNIKCSIILEDSYLGDFPDYQAIGRQLIDKILDMPERPSAIIFSNDARALGGMRALRDAGFSIPDDFSIIGFDNIPSSELFHPALTTVESGYLAGAEAAVEMILNQKMNDYYILPGKLIERESTGPVNTKRTGKKKQAKELVLA